MCLVHNYLLYIIHVDVNECLDNGGKGPCEDTCENHIGGYKCGCSIQGYKLSDDGLTCKGNYKIILLTVFFNISGLMAMAIWLETIFVHVIHSCSSCGFINCR